MIGRPSDRSGETPAIDNYFQWLEREVRDSQLLKGRQERLKSLDPALFRAVAESAAELSEGDPRAHATYFGTFLIMLSEREGQKITPS